MKIASTNENSVSTIKSVRFKSKELLFCSLTTFLLFCLLISPVAAKVTELQISPRNPAVGDTVTVTGKASPGESLTAQVTVHLKAPVSGGQYQLAVNGIKVPSGMNSVTIKASAVKSLRVKLGPFSKEVQASGGTATISGHVPSLTANVVIEGDALSKSSVPITISASKTLKADSDGTFEFEVDTASMPAGTYTVKVGNKGSVVQLGSKGHGNGHGNGQDNWGLGESLKGLFSWIKQLGSK